MKHLRSGIKEQVADQSSWTVFVAKKDVCQPYVILLFSFSHKTNFVDMEASSK